MKHNLSLRATTDSIALDATCHSDKDAICRMTCHDGCESYNIAKHYNGTYLDDEGHELVTGNCNAIEWFLLDDEMLSCLVTSKWVPLADNMEIDVEWIGDGWEWCPTGAAIEQILNPDGKTPPSDQQAASKVQKMGNYAIGRLLAVGQKLATAKSKRTKSSE